MLLMAVLVWTIWSTSVYNGKAGEPATVADPQNNFPTYDACISFLDKTLDEWEQTGVAKRVSQYEIRSNTPLPYGVEMTTRWECREATLP